MGPPVDNGDHPSGLCKRMCLDGEWLVCARFATVSALGQIWPSDKYAPYFLKYGRYTCLRGVWMTRALVYCLGLCSQAMAKALPGPSARS